MSKEWNPGTVFDILGSEEVRRILALTDDGPMSARELAERLDVSQPTVYRRIDTCLDYDLLAVDTRIDEEGNRYQVYETNLQRICFEVDDGGFDVTIALRRDLVDGSGDSWGDVEREGDRE